MSVSFPDDIAPLSWAAENLGIAASTAYRLAASEPSAIPGLFRVGSQYRVSKIAFNRAIHGTTTGSEVAS